MSILLVILFYLSTLRFIRVTTVFAPPGSIHVDVAQSTVVGAFGGRNLSTDADRSASTYVGSMTEIDFRAVGTVLVPVDHLL